VTDLPREELAAATAARRELGPEREPELIDGFLARIERQIDARVEAKIGARREPVKRQGGSDWAAALLGISSLGIGIGATGASTALGNGGPLVAIFAWVAILLVNLLYHRRPS
jgi:hypothetical protein